MIERIGQYRTVIVQKIKLEIENNEQVCEKINIVVPLNLLKFHAVQIYVFVSKFL